MIWRGDVWWADLAEPTGSGPGFQRPVLVVQDNRFNKSAIDTVIVAGITSNRRLRNAPGNVLLRASESGLPKDSVINVSQLLTIDRRAFLEHFGSVSDETLAAVDNGLRLVLGI